jgi:hypothetical protein
MPIGGYFPSKISDNYSRMGFELPPLNFTKMDEFVKNLASRLGVQCIVMSNELRLRKELSNIWYEFDGHLTEYGHEVVAEHVFEALVRSGLIDRKYGISSAVAGQRQRSDADAADR